ncbi:MAG: hypothetical protein IPO06_06740 [Leptospiraceae bacterium]|nr:hypothetical protein [Leptospiraceae bacterium]
MESSDFPGKVNISGSFFFYELIKEDNFIFEYRGKVTDQE